MDSSARQAASERGPLMNIKHPLIAEALTVIGLIAAPFVLPHFGFSLTTINRS